MDQLDEGALDCELNPSELTIFELIGTGSTAEVYRGMYRGNVVAVKKIEWQQSMRLTEKRVFDREVAVMKSVSHRNLVRFEGVTTKEMPFRIITEYCAGGCCFDLLHRSDHIELMWTQQLQMCTDVASAMVYLHSFKPQIIHRDLKSFNLLLVNKVVRGTVPHVKVSDFGVARMKEHAQAEWGSMTAAAGTCHWMAPEVFEGTKYDEKADVYSFGMLLFEIICREVPFEDQHVAEVARKIMRGERPDLDAVPPDCPGRLQNLMINCWDHDPTLRPSSSAVLALLRSIRPETFSL
jgi:serine/threonine protein kinase